MTPLQNFKQIGYSALALLFIAFAIKWIGAPIYYFWILIAVVVFLKLFFVLFLFKEKKLKPGIGLYLIMTGVALILASLALDKIFFTLSIHKVLFYIAITLKITGIAMILLVNGKVNASKQSEEII